MNPLRQLSLDHSVKKAAIIHSGAIGDCVLTLPLAVFLKQTLGFHQVDLIGRTEYTSFYPARTAVDRIRSIESVPLHRLFESPNDFIQQDHTRLIHAFCEYEHIISFLGTENPAFEENLLFVIHCSHSGELTMLPMAPQDQQHAAQFYIHEFIRINPCFEYEISDLTRDIYIRPLPTDMAAGSDILSRFGISEQVSFCLIHPGSGGKHKCWAAEKFLCLAEHMRKKNLEPVFLFGPAEQERLTGASKDRFRQAGRVLAELDLTSVYQILTCADCVVGNDSGISHIAGAMGKKTEVIFGPTNPTHYCPLGPNVTTIRADLRDFETQSS